jgi:hypothetical protein
MLRAWHALAAYLALAVVATWPLARGLARDVPADLADPVFVMWVLAWDCEQLLAILGGDLSRLSTFFDANIFHPVPLTLAYSEHFLAQAVQVLPVWAVTGNPILCYNLLYLSTFVLSGLGAYLFVRELTGNPRAAFVAGVLFAFAPYRFPQSSHLHVLSSQWMPFALYGFRRFFDSFAIAASKPVGRWLPLLGAAAALLVQNLSSTYYLMFFSPFAAAYVLWEVWRRQLWRTWRLWLQLGAAATVVLALTVPMLLPYAAVQDQLHVARERGELSAHTADVYSYFTAVSEQVVWGNIARAYPKSEGDLFPGLVAVALAVIGIATWRRDAPTIGASTVSRTAWVLIGAAALHLLAAAATLLYRRVILDVGLFEVRITNIDQLLLRALVLTTIAAVVSPGCRTRIAEFMRARGFFVLALILAVWLSLGVSPLALGRPLNLTGIYTVLYEYVPGFDGLRVPARFAMVVVLMLAVLGGYGAAALSRWRWATPALAVLTTAFLTESIVRPFPINGTRTLRDYAAPEPRVYRPARAPAVYQRLAREPAVVLAELPMGQLEYDIRAMFYSIVHRGKLLNGYSGFFPRHYGVLALALSDVPSHTTIAWDALREAGASHVIVHEAAWLDDRGPRTTAAFVQLGAVEVFRDRTDVLMRLPGPGSP